MVLYHILIGAEMGDFTHQFLSVRKTTIVDVLILLVVVSILVILIVQLLYRNCCERRSDKGELSVSH